MNTFPWKGKVVCSPLASQPSLPSRMQRSPGCGWKCTLPVLPRAAPSSQKETAYVCPAWAHPCLPRSITSGTLRTLGTSHPSACLQIKLTEYNPQAGNSLLGPPHSSHGLYTLLGQRAGQPHRVSHRSAYWPTLTPTQSRPQMSGQYRVCVF